MTEPVVPVVPVTPWLTFATWVKDTLERSVATFVVAVLSLLGVSAVTDLNMDWGKKLGTAAIIAIAAFVKNAAIPRSGFGLPPALDVVARAAWSGVQAGAAVILLADTAFAWYSASAWQTVGVAALAAALSAIKGVIAVRIQPDDTVTPASLAKA